MANLDHSTLVSLFYTEEQAQKTLADLSSTGIPTSAVETLSKADAADLNTSALKLETLKLPAADLKLLRDGIGQGGTVIIVTVTEEMAQRAEAIFRKHHSHQVDERVLRDDSGVAAPRAAAGGATELEEDITIPVVEEELVVGKRAVQTGGVRVISRVVKTPVSESVTLHEEHARIERRAVNRAATDADLHAAGETIEVLESSEEAVVGKTARVVEEIVVGKDSSDRMEKVTDTVRKTEVDVEQVAADQSEVRKKNRR